MSPRFIVTRKRHLFERVEVIAPSAAEAKRLAQRAADAGETQKWGGIPENWRAQKAAES